MTSPMKIGDLDGKIILVAGAAGGIGTGTCRLLASRGSTLIMVNRPNPALGLLLDKVRLDSPRSIELEEDLSQLDAWDRVVAAAIGTFGRVDALVHCVGRLVSGPLEQLSEQDIQRVIGANVLSVVYAMKAVITVMRKQKSGHIVIVGSLGGVVPMPFEALYSSTKFALRGLCLSLNEELKGTGIHVSLVEPGPVQTKMLEVAADHEESAMSFVNSPIKPGDVAEAIVQVLRSPKAELILPRWVGFAARLVSLFPRSFSALFPLLHFLGRRRLPRFRTTLRAAGNTLLMPE